MISVVESGEDTHTHTSHLMFRLSKDIIVEDHKIIGHLTDADEIWERRTAMGLPADLLPRTMRGRKMGKKSNHGLNYDEGYNTFALTNEIEIPESKRIVNLYHSIYPGIRLHFHEGIKRQLTKDRSLANCFGRKIRFLDAWGDDLFKAAYSAIPQSTVGDNTNQGMCLIYGDSYLTGREELNIDLLAQGHDSLLLQVPFAALEGPFGKVIERVYTHMEPQLEYNGRQFKIATDSKFGLNWGSHHPEANPTGMKELTKLEEIRGYLVGARIR